MDERLRFVARLLDGEKMATLCAEFGISRKTGYEIFERYKDCGIDRLTDRSRRPYRHNQLPPAIEQWIVRRKQEYPSLGAPRIREQRRERCADVRCPAINTVLDRAGHASAARSASPGGLADRRYCYPLTSRTRAGSQLASAI